MATFNVSITNGTGSAQVPAGTYSASAVAFGFDDATLSPTSLTLGDSSTTSAFTVDATGTLTFTVNETGAVGGTPITSGSIVMTDSTGAVEYGSAQSISSLGECVFNNVPFGNVTTGYTLYFKQLSSDSTHEPVSGVITVNMDSNNTAQFIQNTAIASQAFTLESASYTGLPVNGGTITLEN